MEKLRNTAERHAAEFWNHWKSGGENSLKIIPPYSSPCENAGPSSASRWAEIPRFLQLDLEIAW